ncbi:hypothetical protein VTI28DRAFT_4961 [Corynascus sepedonium]
MACHLSALPSELFDRIFFELESVSDVTNLAATARFAYRHFNSRKEPILFHLLRRELGPVLRDAKFLLLFPYGDPAEGARYHDWIHTMAEVYWEMQWDPAFESDGIWRGPLPNLEELIRLFRTLRCVNILADAFVEAQLRSFQEGDEAILSPAAAPLSRSERLRVVRSFYRRQIVSNAWAPTRRPVYRDWSQQDGDALATWSWGKGPGVRRGLFDAWAAWELGQIDHIDFFIGRLCMALLHCSRLDDTTVRPIEKTDFADMYAHINRLVSYLQTHPDLADAALRSLPTLGPNEDEFAEFAGGMDSIYAKSCSIYPLPYAFNIHRGQTLPDSQSSTWDRARAEVEFSEDHVLRVPYGWVDMTVNLTIDWYGEVIGCVSAGEDMGLGFVDVLVSAWRVWKCSGFPLWDKDRIVALKKMEKFRSLYTGWLRPFGPRS